MKSGTVFLKQAQNEDEYQASKNKELVPQTKIGFDFQVRVATFH